MENSDRDILIRIDTNIENVVKKLDDHESRLRFLEKYAYILMGGLTLLSVALNFLSDIFSKK